MKEVNSQLEEKDEERWILKERNAKEEDDIE